MAGLSVGARVIADRPIQDRNRQFKIARGSAGVIVGRSGIFVTTYRVKFGQGGDKAIIDRVPARSLRLDPESTRNKLLRSPRKR